MQMFALSSLLIILSCGMKQKETCGLCFENITDEHPARRTICCDITNYHKDCYWQALDYHKKCLHCNTSFQAIMEGKNRRQVQWKFQKFAKKYQKCHDDEANNYKEIVHQLCNYVSGLNAWKSKITKSIKKKLSDLEEENEELVRLLNSEATKFQEAKYKIDNKNNTLRERIRQLTVSLDKVEMKNQEEERENECLRKENRQIKKGYQNFSQENAEQRRLNEKLRQEKNESNETIEDLKQSIAEVQKENDGVREENENAKREIRKLKKFYEKYNKKDTFFKKENQLLREQLENPELRRVHDEWNNLQKQNLFSAENEKIKKESDLNERNFCKEKTSMHSEIAELREKIKTRSFSFCTSAMLCLRSSIVSLDSFFSWRNFSFNLLCSAFS
jgi:chromosome segregation ATPase